MGQPQRPTEAITYKQAKQYESNPVKWINFHGYITNIHELADVFGINHDTLLRRLSNEWPLEAALIADTRSGWNAVTVQLLQNETTLSKVQLILANHFTPNPNKSKNKKGGKS